MIMDIFVDQTGHFSWWYDMRKNSELLFITEMNESQREGEFVLTDIC